MQVEQTKKTLQTDFGPGLLWQNASGVFRNIYCQIVIFMADSSHKNNTIISTQQ